MSDNAAAAALAILKAKTGKDAKRVLMPACKAVFRVEESSLGISAKKSTPFIELGLVIAKTDDETTKILNKEVPDWAKKVNKAQFYLSDGALPMTGEFFRKMCTADAKGNLVAKWPDFDNLPDLTPLVDCVGCYILAEITHEDDQMNPGEVVARIGRSYWNEGSKPKKA